MKTGLVFLLGAWVVTGCSSGGEYNTKPSANSAAAASLASTLNGQAQKLIQAKCAACHGQNSPGRGGFRTASDISAMIVEGKIVPGAPESSRIYQRVLNNQMPPSGPLSDKEKMLMATWIYNLYVDPNSAFGKVFTGLLQPRCLACHGPGKANGGVSFETWTDTMKVVTPGKPEFSLMYQVVVNGRMPKGKAPLSAAELSLLSGWISAGALR